MVSLYINDTYTKENKEKKLKKRIGVICPKHGMPFNPTEFFTELQQQLSNDDFKKENEMGHHKRPEFHGIGIPICDKITNIEKQTKCNSKLHDKKLFSKPSWHRTDNKDGSFSYQLNNPYIEFICKKCRTRRTAGLPMPYPLPKKYREPPKEPIKI